MSDSINQLYKPVLEKTNLRLDVARQRLVIDIPFRSNIGIDTFGRHAKGGNAAKTALIYEDIAGGIERYTFAEIHRLALRFAKGLKTLGVQRGDVVAVHTGQCPETAIAHTAIHYLGGIVLTLSQLYGPDTIEHILKDSKCRIIISESTTWTALRKYRPRFESVEHCILNDGIEPNEALFTDVLAADSDGLEPVNTLANDPALLMYTSGSTGMPKGMLHAHRIIHAYRPTLTMFFNLELDLPNQIFWSPADWAWVGGLLDLALPAWQSGQTVVASQHRFTAEWAFEFMAQHNITHSFMTPTALKRLAEISTPKERWPLKLRVVCTGGESLPSNVVRWAEDEIGIVCNEFYGLTEFNHLVGNCEALYPIVPGSMGRSLPGRTVAIIDEEGQEQKDGVVGEIASLHSEDPSLFLGYWGQPSNSKTLHIGKWLRSGDLALRDSDGYFWYQGRNDDLIKSAGYRIGPAEVEDTLIRHPKVAEAAVVGRRNEERGQIVVAFIRLASQAHPTDQLKKELQDHVKFNLAYYKYPREVYFVNSFPMTSSGKIRRKALRDELNSD